jgi:hypothetical protein
MPALASKRKVAHIACNAILLFGNLVLIASLAAVAANTQYSWYALVTVPAATLACIAGLGFAHGIATANASS